MSHDGDGLVPIHEEAQYQELCTAGQVAGVAGMTARCSVRVPVEIKGSWTAANDDVMDEEGKERLAGWQALAGGLSQPGDPQLSWKGSRPSADDGVMMARAGPGGSLSRECASRHGR